MPSFGSADEDVSLLHKGTVHHKEWGNDAPRNRSTTTFKTINRVVAALTLLLFMSLITYNVKNLCVTCTSLDELAGSTEQVTNHRVKPTRLGVKTSTEKEEDTSKESTPTESSKVVFDGMQAEMKDMLCFTAPDWTMEKIRISNSEQPDRKYITIMLTATPRVSVAGELDRSQDEIKKSNDAMEQKKACGSAPLRGGKLMLQFWPIEQPKDHKQLRTNVGNVSWTPDNLPVGFQNVVLTQSGCIFVPSPAKEQAKRSLYTFTGLLSSLLSDTYYQYRIGHVCSDGYGTEQQSLGYSFYHYGTPLLAQERTPVGPVLAKPQSVLVVGDMGTRGPDVIQGLSTNTDVSLFLLIGDASYATNTGSCYNGKGIGCTWNCARNETSCESYKRIWNSGIRNSWKKWNKMTFNLFAGTPTMSTNGNHDNDWHWYMQFRAPGKLSYVGVEDQFLSETQRKGTASMLDTLQYYGSPVEQIKEVNELLTEPYFYSFQQGLVQFISFGTEDNVNNAYETKSSSIPMRDERFELHYGVNSVQYKWLENELKQASKNRRSAPWIVVYTHRPLTHTSSHHPMCSSRGDWYGCKIRDLYAPMFSKYGVDLVIAGHSHHYARLKPFNGVEMAPEGVDAGTERTKVGKNATAYAICGTGGLKQGMGLKQTPFVAFQMHSIFGYCKLEVISAQEMKFLFYQTSSNGGKEVVEGGQVLKDSTTFYHTLDIFDDDEKTP